MIAAARLADQSPSLSFSNCVEMSPVETEIAMSIKEIGFKPAPGRQVTPQADFTYKITPGVISINDTGLGRRSVTNDIQAVLRKIEYWHQGSIGAFKIMYRDSEGIWDGVNWDGQSVSFFALRETDEDKARDKLRTPRGGWSNINKLKCGKV
jgi:hypothetical protein